MHESRLGRWFSSLKLDLYTIFPQIISQKLMCMSAVHQHRRRCRHQHRRCLRMLKRICVFRVHLIECIWTSCSAKACMIYDGLWHANVWFGLVMMSIYDGNTKKKPRQNSQLLFTIHCTHFKSASHSSIFLPNTLTCLVPP